MISIFSSFSRNSRGGGFLGNESTCHAFFLFLSLVLLGSKNPPPFLDFFHFLSIFFPFSSSSSSSSFLMAETLWKINWKDFLFLLFSSFSSSFFFFFFLLLFGHFRISKSCPVLLTPPYHVPTMSLSCILPQCNAGGLFIARFFGIV